MQNLAAVAAAAQAPGALLGADGDSAGEVRTQLRGYVRNESDLPVVAALLAARLPTRVAPLLMRGDICRRELLVEIEATVSWREGQE